MRSGLFLLIVAVVSLSGAPLSPAAAQTSIKVVANGVAITSYDIAQRARLKQLANEKGGTKVATEELIDEAIQLYEAKQRGVTVSNSDVDNAYASIAKQVKLSPVQFGKALSEQGVNPTTLKNRLRAQIGWHTLVQARMMRASVASSKEITDALASAGKPKEVTTSEFILKQIIFVVPKGSGAAYTAQRRREAESFRLRFGGCDKAVEQSIGLRDVAVRDIGRRNSLELTGQPGDAIKATAVGKTTPPSTTDQGVELIAVCSKREIQSQAAARVDVENKLAEKQGTQIAKDYLKELKDKAVIEYR